MAAAKAALTGAWGAISATDHGMRLHRIGQLIDEHAASLAEIEARDNGKLLSEVMGQIKYVAKYFCYYSGLADKIQGSVIPIDKPKVFNYTRYEPMGVVATITPWNSSLLLTAWKIAPALCAGNTVVCKPSEYTSASLLELAKIMLEAELPDGLFNVVTGFGTDVGEPLIRHPDVARVAFTGGDIGGKAVAKAAAETLKPITLELGGKSPNIVFDDAELDKAVNDVITGIVSAGGQTCMAGSCLLLQDSIHDAFVEKLLAVTRRAKAGDPRKPGIQVGPVATKPQFDKVMHYIDVAKAEGARCIAGGRALTGSAFVAGQIGEPRMFADGTDAMRIA